ncbi:MAG TPA: patatin-like phospholipase family protein [Mycobacteriales bacterium]|jgi:NTE family protein|nr:patatin-like phospholipase family protein [Mycobacteriales bacterium]
MTTAFVLSGGGSLGSVQVGMLLALAERGVTPDLVVGTSVGAINAAYIAGRPGLDGVKALAEIWSGLSRRQIFPTDPLRLVRVAARREPGFANPAPLRRLLERHLGYESVQDARCTLTVVATEVATGREVNIARGNVVDAVMASAALPGVFPPVQVGVHLLMDGGVVNNTPISAAVSAGADVVYVLPTGYACALEHAPRSPIGMAMQAVTVAIQQRLISDVQALQDSVTLRVAPPLCPLAVSPVDFSHTAELVERAHDSTVRWLDRPAAADQSRDLRLHSHHVSR